jgi:putative endonuclease
VKTKIIGQKAENLATDFLLSQGYEIVARNWRFKNFGEIDIIAKKDDVLNFIEVKSLLEDKNFLPEDHFNIRKFRKIQKLASFYSNKYNFQKWIISLITIVFQEKPKIKYYENIQKEHLETN